MMPLSICLMFCKFYRLIYCECKCNGFSCGIYLFSNLWYLSCFRYYYFNERLIVKSILDAIFMDKLVLCLGYCMVRLLDLDTKKIGDKIF
jgi:hypothetical protein